MDNITNSGEEDIFVVKYDSSGNRQWTKQYGTSAQDIANALALDSSGNIYVTGQTTGNMDGNTKGDASYSDIFLIKLNSSGEKY